MNQRSTNTHNSSWVPSIQDQHKYNMDAGVYKQSGCSTYVAIARDSSDSFLMGFTGFL